MNDRLHEVDQTRAIFAALGSFWWRMAVFFLLCWLGHFVGQNCASAGEFFENVLSNGPRALFENRDLNPLTVPLSWMWTLLIGCENGYGVLQLAALAVALLFVRLSEDRFIHGFAIASLTQPIDSFLVAVPHSVGDFTVGLIVLLGWEMFLGFAYWWCLRQMD